MAAHPTLSNLYAQRAESFTWRDLLGAEVVIAFAMPALTSAFLKSQVVCPQIEEEVMHLHPQQLARIA